MNFLLLSAQAYADELARRLVEVPTPLGRLTRLGPVIQFSDGALQDLPVWRASGDLGAAWAD